MEVLGEPREKTVDFFRCVEKPFTRVEGASRPTLTDVRSSLLSASSHFGYLCVAKGDRVLVFELKALRDGNSDVAPIASVSFGKHNVGAILSIAFLLGDTALAVHARPAKAGTPVLILASFTALVNGFVSSLPCPAVADDLENVTIRLQHHDDVHSTSQCIATLSKSGAVHLHWVSSTVSEVESVRVDEDGLGSDGVLCLALSPGDELLAVGTKRGSVSLYATDGVSLRTTIGAVESGWMPFSVHFASADAVFVSYACEDEVLHVMWTIAEENGEMVAKDPSSLGELCFPSLSKPLSSDGEESGTGGEGAGEQQPVISICPIPGWDVCVVTSSLSTDVEVISSDDDGRWEKWNLDEGKSATLPVDGNDVDTQPLGIALDLTDTSIIDSVDPSTPRVNSMPRLIVFTTDSLLLPFQLIDDRPGAKCEYVKSPTPLPPVPVASGREEQIPILDVASDVKDAIPGLAVMSSAGFAAVPTLQSLPAATMGAGQAPSFAAIAKGEADSVFKSPFGASASMPVFGATHHDSGTVPSVTSSFAHVRGRTESTSSDDSESSESSSSGKDTNSGSDRESPRAALETGLASLPSGFDRLMGGPGVAPFASAPVSSNAFTDTEKFLSKFQFSPAPKEEGHVRGDGALSCASTGSLFEAPQTGITAISNPESVVTRVPKSLPSFPPQPTYEGAAAAVSTGKPLDLIRSMLLEMQEEIKYHSDAYKVCDERLRMTGIAMSSDIEAVSADVVDIQDSMQSHFREEAALRKQVLDSLKEMLALSCEFESLSLEFRIREEEGFTSRIRAEEKAADEKLTKKEAEILKSIASIEGRLNAHLALKGAKGNQTEQIQQIYSSLSLQSIRVRRIQSLLVALTERVRDISRDGRRSDLGLSMARLEKLSIAHNQSPRTGVNGSLERTDTFSGTGKVAEGAEYSQQNGTSSIALEDSSVISEDVRRVLQRLAMRSGRANICVKRVRPKPLKVCSERRREGVSAEVERNDINKKRLLNGEDPSLATSNGAVGEDCGRSISYGTSPFLRPEMQRAAPTDNRNGRSFAEIRLNGAKNEQPVGRQVAPANHDAEVSKGGLSGSIGNVTWGSGSDEGRAGGLGVFEDETTAVNSSPAALESVSTRKSGPATSPPRSSDGKRQTPAAVESRIVFTKQSRTPFATQPPDSATKSQQADVAERARASLAQHSSAARPERETGGNPSNLSAVESSGSDVASNISGTPPSFVPRPPDSSVPAASSVAERATPASNKDDGSFASVKMGPPTVSKEGSEVKISEVSDALKGSLNMFGMRESTATDASESLMGAEVTIDATALPTWQTKASETLFGGSQFTNPVSSSPVFGAAFGAARPAESVGTGASGSGSSTDSDSDGRPAEATGAGMEMTGSGGGGTFGAGQGTVGGGSLFGSFQSSAQPSQAWGTTGGWGSSGSSMFGSGTSAAAPLGAAVMQDPPAAGAFSSGGQDKTPLSFGGMGGASSGGFAGADAAAFGAPSTLGGATQPAAFSSATSAPGFGASAQFGMASSLGAAPSFGAPSQIGGGAAFGQPSGWGAQFSGASQTGGAQFGSMSQMGTGFGGTGGGGPSPFAAAQGSAGTAGFGAGGGGFGAGGGSAMDQSNAGGGGFGSASPFSNTSGTGFGGQSGGGSGFASLASSGGFGGGQPSGFGNGAPPVFGSDQGPPAFKSAAFSQRRG